MLFKTKTASESGVPYPHRKIQFISSLLSGMKHNLNSNDAIIAEKFLL